MELSWSTFILEIINFLALVWILNYFFYTPLQRTIAERKQKVQEQLANAEQRHNEAHQLQIQYDNRLAEWQQEKDRLQKEFQQAMDLWKSKEMAAFEKKLKKEQEQVKALEMKKASKLIEKNAKESFALAGLFTKKLLMNFADESLEKKIIEKTIEELSRYPEKPLQFIEDGSEQGLIKVQSVYAMNQDQQHRLRQTLEQLVGKKLNVDWAENSELLAGVRIQMGSVIFQANLRDELTFFAERSNELT
jgi:F-type H+-transporting ATPase subunit b